MHELSITQSMLGIVLEQTEKAGARKVNRINLVIGEMCGYVEECVQFYFDFLAKGTPAEKAVLSFKMVPPEARCRECGTTFQPGEFNWSCTGCGSVNIEITAGKELFVESIEVD
ncbi:MAG TPA: hydrogenase maturation nickel metallochaperone HypA [Dehalococcoidia bacterium]|nr:hydrogenase maturation nickel metallochaperone HypA [Dehalococcoidia bacterium]